MLQSSSTSAPASQTMQISDADYGHASNMALYHMRRSEFEQSPYRVACDRLGDAAVCAGTLGCLVVVPTVAATVAWPGAKLIASVTSLFCCLAAPVAYHKARRPYEPNPPSVEEMRSRERGGG